MRSDFPSIVQERDLSLKSISSWLIPHLTNLISLAHTTSLLQLHFWQGNISDLGFNGSLTKAVVAHLSGLTSLLHLGLSRGKLGAEGPQELASYLTSLSA